MCPATAIKPADDRNSSKVASFIFYLQQLQILCRSVESSSQPELDVLDAYLEDAACRSVSAVCKLCCAFSSNLETRRIDESKTNLRNGSFAPSHFCIF